MPQTKAEQQAYRTAWRKANWEKKTEEEKEAWRAARRGKYIPVGQPGNNAVKQKDMPPERKRLKAGYDLKKKYGLTILQFEEMSAAQFDRCKICQRNAEEVYNAKKRLCVDHCHVTNKIRGLLCADCNRVLGLVRDDDTILQKAIEYLINSRKDEEK